MDKFGLKEFEALETSTSTVMVYTNINFNIRKIYECLKLSDVTVPLTKKQKNVDKKKLSIPYGSIIAVQSKTSIRGIDLRKKKKIWCTVCQPVKVIDDKKKKINTVTEQLRSTENVEEIKIKKKPAKKNIIVEKENDENNTKQTMMSTFNHSMDIMYYCSKCQKLYRPEEMKKINHFLNQITIVMSIGEDHPLLNIMMFKDNMKIAGCKNIDDAVEATLILWQDYIFPNSSLWELKNGNSPRFVFETVMRNIDFNLGFPIERHKLNFLMNSEKYSDKVFMSQYESTGNPNVNIKMFSQKPEDFTYDCLVVPVDTSKKPYFKKLKNIPYKRDEKKKVKKKYTTFIVFSSSEIILSGRYDKNMKDMYEFFIDTVFTHKKEIEEKLEKRVK